VRLGLGRVIVLAYERFLEHHCGDHAAAVSYYTLLSLLPLCLFLISIGLAFQGSFESAYTGTLFVLQGVVTHLDDASRESLHRFMARATRLQWPALILLAWTSRRIFSSLFGALGRVFGVPPWGFAEGHLFAVAMVLLMGIALLTTLAFTFTLAAAEGFLQQWAGAPSAVAFQDLTILLLTQVAPPIITFVFVLAVYRIASRGRVSTATAAGGALLATLLWELAKAAFAYYVRNLAHYTGVYGALEGVIVLAVWLELSVTILLYCAEIVGTFSGEEGRDSIRTSPSDT
jgi:membrane protein